MWKRTNKVAIYLLTTLFVIFFSNHVILLLHKSSEQERYNSITQVVTSPDPKPVVVVDGDSPQSRPWYMAGGELRPGLSNVSMSLYPEQAPGHDRIPSQINFIPPDTPESQDSSELPLKKVLFWTGANSWGIKPGRGVFLKEQCPVSTCVISTRRKDSASADLIIFKDHFIMPSFDRPKKQLWMIFMLESPLNTQQFKRPSVFNWTATYRSDSTVVTPYERWEYYDPGVRALNQTVNYAANKSKKVAWFVSNCAARNGRLEYARNLSKYIDVDIYGECGSQKCPRASKDCYKILNSQYKFYLAFENSNCVDYITEKFFVNGLKYNILPIVMGARKQDYVRSAPEKSFIHVDDFDGPEQLAKYLHKLDNDDNLYNEYFQWKGTGEMINTKFFCRVCSLLHDEQRTRDEASKYYKDINNWWRGRGICVKDSWRNHSNKTNNSAL